MNELRKRLKERSWSDNEIDQQITACFDECVRILTERSMDNTITYDGIIKKYFGINNMENLIFEVIHDTARKID